MQWILMVAGLVLGAVQIGTLTGAVLGGLCGLVLAQAIRLNRLGSENARLRESLDAFTKRSEQSTQALYQRLRALEQGGAGGAITAEPDAKSSEPAVPGSEGEAPVRQAVEALSDRLTPDQQPGFAETSGWAEPEPEPPARPSPAGRQPDVSDWERIPTPAVAPPTPGLLERGLMAAWDWLLGGNTLVRIGVVLLFLGLAFLLRYATERVVVPIELRYMAVAASAVALLGLGWWLRRRNPNYALILQGTGVGVLYLTVFAAMRLHPLIEPQVAFALLVLVTLCSGMLAVLQDALGLAAAAALGGFAAPILASSGSGDHVALFSYFALLNAGILVIAWFKAWRLLNLIGFVGTFGIGFTWGLRAYTPELFWSTEPFLVLFFLMYVAIGLLFARRKLLAAQSAPEARGELLSWSARQADYVDTTALFGPPLVGFGLQYAVIQHLEFGPAFSALGLGLFYLLLAWLLRIRTGERALLLVEVCLSLGVVFGTLAIPLGLDARWTSAAWAVEGAGIYWIGLRQHRTLARAFALLLQTGAILAFVGDVDPGRDSLLDGPPLGALLIGVALLFSFMQLRRSTRDEVTEWEWNGRPLLALGGLVFLYLIAPLLFMAQGTAICWALAGLVTLYGGLRIQSRPFLLSAFVIQLLGGALFLLTGDGGGLLLSGRFTGGSLDGAGLTPLAHAGFWTPAVLALTALLGGWLLDRELRREPPPELVPQLSPLAWLLPVWAAGWWAFAAAGEVLRFVSPSLQTAELLLAAAGTALLWTLLARRLQWRILALLALLLTPVGVLILLDAWHGHYHPAAGLGWLGWAALAGVHLLSLWRLDPLLSARWRSAAHVLGCWLILGVLALELRYLLLTLSDEYNAWRWLGWALIPSSYLLLVSRLPRLPWPIAAHGREYRLWAALPLAGLMLLWFWLANTYSDGAADPLPYIPLLNPLEVGLLFALLGVGVWMRQAGPQFGFSERATGLAVQGVSGLSLFFLATAMVFRIVHHWLGVPYAIEPLLASMEAQAGLSLIWTSIALGLMISGHRRGRRELWLIGAALIGLVVTKLFFVELGNRGGLERIVSFIGVGVLLLVIGYFAPLPPRRPASKESEEG